MNASHTTTPVIAAHVECQPDRYPQPLLLRWLPLHASEHLELSLTRGEARHLVNAINKALNPSTYRSSNIVKGGSSDE